jgi:hypothetical protein
LKIPDCGPTSAARELKKEVNVPTESTNKKKYQKIQKVFSKKNFLEKLLINMFLHFSVFSASIDI